MTLTGSRLAVARAKMNQRMTEWITAGKFTDGVNPDTGNPTRVPDGDPVYEGPARVKYSDNAVRSAEGASQLVASQSVTVSIPTQPASLSPTEGLSPTDGLAPNKNIVLPEGTDIVVVSSASDPALVGRSYRVDGSPTLGQSTAHRYQVTELS